MKRESMRFGSGKKKAPKADYFQSFRARNMGGRCDANAGIATGENPEESVKVSSECGFDRIWRDYEI